MITTSGAADVSVVVLVLMMIMMMVTTMASAPVAEVVVVQDVVMMWEGIMLATSTMLVRTSSPVVVGVRQGLHVTQHEGSAAGRV